MFVTEFVKAVRKFDRNLTAEAVYTGQLVRVTHDAVTSIAVDVQVGDLQSFADLLRRVTADAFHEGYEAGQQES